MHSLIHNTQRAAAFVLALLFNLGVVAGLEALAVPDGVHRLERRAASSLSAGPADNATR